MRRLQLLTICLAVATAACSAPERLPEQGAGDVSQEQRAPHRFYTAESELLYHTLLAELASRRGQLDTAYDSYLAASRFSDDPQLPERAARIAVFAKAWEKAVIASERWLSLDTYNPEVRHILATSYMRLKNSELAFQQLVVIIDRHPDGIEQGMAVAYALLKHEPNQVLSQEIAKRLAGDYQHSPSAQFNVARLSALMGDKTSTMEALDDTLALQSDHTDAALLRAQMRVEAGETNEAFDELEKALANSPQDLALNLGYTRLLVQAGKDEEAVDAMAATYAIAPNNADVVLSLGLMALESRRLEIAKDYLNHVLTLGRRSSDAHYYLGRIADSQRDYEVAIDHYSSVSTGEMQLDSQTRITELMALLGHVEQARFRLQRLRELNPGEDRQIHFLLVENKILRETGHHQEALELLTEALELYPENVDILYARALAAEKVGRDDLFEQHLRTVLQIEPDNARALNALGYFLADRSRELDEAERYIRQAIAIMPSDPAIIDSLGWVSYRQGNYAEALRLLRQAYQLLFDPEIAAHLGEVLWVSGDRESATEIWNDALEQSPEDALLKDVINRFSE